MARVRVTDPYSGVTLSVEEGSPQAKAWGEPSTVRVEEPEVVAVKAPAKRGRPKKSE